ncbi:MAG TPA: hypothetical protein V6D17_08700, partial [Candidatus Obscuribacterales bacterium]
MRSYLQHVVEALRNLLPKFNINMTWFLYGGVGLMLMGVYLFWIGSSEPPSNYDIFRFHDRAPFADIEEIVKNTPRDVTGLTFVKVPGQDTPVRVIMDGNDTKTV